MYKHNDIIWSEEIDEANVINLVRFTYGHLSHSMSDPYSKPLENAKKGEVVLVLN
jgi:hypothetical protein